MLSKRLDNVAPSVTVGISSKVKEMRANGIDVISLSIGEPDFNIPETVRSPWTTTKPSMTFLLVFLS